MLGELQCRYSDASDAWIKENGNVLGLDMVSASFGIKFAVFCGAFGSKTWCCC